MGELSEGPDVAQKTWHLHHPPAAWTAAQGPAGRGELSVRLVPPDPVLAFALGDGIDRAAADAGLSGDLPLGELPLGQQATDLGHLPRRNHRIPPAGGALAAPAWDHCQSDQSGSIQKSPCSGGASGSASSRLNTSQTSSGKEAGSGPSGGSQGSLRRNNSQGLAGIPEFPELLGTSLDRLWVIAASLATCRFRLLNAAISGEDTRQDSINCTDVQDAFWTPFARFLPSSVRPGSGPLFWSSFGAEVGLPGDDGGPAAAPTTQLLRTDLQ